MDWLYKIPASPRQLLRAIAFGAVALVGNGFIRMDALAIDLGPGSTAPVRPFRLDQVQLGSGLLQEKRDRIKAFIQSYDERKFLVLFNNQAGRPNPSGVTPPGGWEDGGLLSGHWTGHYMTALSQAYVDQGEQVFKTKLDWMIGELAACQQAITARMKGGAGTGAASWIPTHPGYLGALPEDTVLRLGPPRWAVYGGNLDTNTWAPWYTQHKIIRGLLDAYYNTNSSQALKVATTMADWAYLALTIGDKNHPQYTGNLTRDNLNYMWDLYIGGEYGGANEVFSEVYQITNDARHLQTAKAFDNRESLFGAAVANKDILVVNKDNIPGRRRPYRLHANQHVPNFVGYLRVFEQGGGQDYFAAAKNFYDWLVPHRQFVTGGFGGSYPGTDGNGELFQNRDNIANAIASTGAETCTAYNVLKLARNLFLHEHNATYMDNYERGLFNQISGSRADTTSTRDPQLTYFQQLTPGTPRDFGNTGTCCGGTGMESHTKYQETVYFRSADGSALWVNLYIPSTLTWAEKGFTVKQETTFPRGDSAKFTVTGQGPLDIKLRVPAWVRKGFKVTINGQAQVDEVAQPGSYLTLSRTWKKGDVIEVSMPFSIRIERALDRPDTQAIMWGPVLLQLVGKPSTANGGYFGLSLYQYLKRDGDYSKTAIKQTGVSAAGDSTFKVTNGSLTARPYYIGDSQVVSSYFRRIEPTVVFGTINAGVPNRKRNDGLPSYDVPVSGITSPGTDGPTFLDLVWEQAPFSTHDAFVKAVTSTADKFVAAGVYSAQERDTIVAKAGQTEKELTPN
ncbi:hypothetical protein F4803DRAFT_280088 [Xylaria telfairii]|nr:hypothetical protein F4803DRAFT_280088 [Xylaria telfairii]